MLSNLEWFQASVANLSDDSQRIQLLSDLKIAVNALDSNQLQLISKCLPLGGIFDCLNSSEQEQVELTADVLNVLLSALDLGQILDQYGALLMRALAHPLVKVKEMVIKELRRATTGPEQAERLLREQDLLLTLVDCVSHDDVGVAKSAKLLLAEVGKTDAGLGVLFRDPVLQRLKDAMEGDNVVRFRIYELGVDIACHSAPGLSAGLSSGLLSSLLSEVSGRDVLRQLNTLELLASLALTEHGLRHLQADGVLAQLAGKMAAVDGDPLAGLMLPGFIKFFGSVAQRQPVEIFSQYPIVLEIIFNTLDNPDPIVANIAMDTIGYIATSVAGKHLLHNLGEKMIAVVQRLGNGAKSTVAELRERSLNTIRDLLQLKPTDQDARSLAVTGGWFTLLAADPLDLVMSACKLPFLELRLAGLHVLLAASEQPWGRAALANAAGVLEFLTNRALEPDKACKEAKYAAVKALVSAPDVEALLCRERVQHLAEYLKEGPFFTQVHTEFFIEHMAA